MSTLHERLAAARKLRRITQQAIADHLGLGQSAVSHWCTGRSEPDRTTVAALASLLRVRPAWLLLGDGPMVDDAPTSPTPTPPRAKKASAKRSRAPRPGLVKARTKRAPKAQAATRAVG